MEHWPPRYIAICNTADLTVALTNRTPGGEPPELESRQVLKRCVSARAALAELRVAAALIPNPAVLINTLPLLEAQASSEIENVVTTADGASAPSPPGPPRDA